MRSDELTRRALDAIEPRRHAFHGAVATAVDEVQVRLDEARPRKNGKGERIAAELGAFASGRIDVDRFASVFADREALSPDAVTGIEAALATLMAIRSSGDELYGVRLPAGGDLRAAVRDALARTGAAFGAARAVENLRTGAAPAPYADGFVPERWNRAEREIAPPLVMDLDGADLRPAGLADYLDGRQALVLIVRKASPPAALARLIAPGVLVAQAPTADVLDALEGWAGPAIVAVAPESETSFTYRPDEDGPGTLTVHALPGAKIRALGTLSAARQAADVGLLRMLEGAGAARVVSAAAAPAASTEPVDPADKLAAWLLRQATIPAPGEEA